MLFRASYLVILHLLDYDVLRRGEACHRVLGCLEPFNPTEAAFVKGFIFANYEIYLKSSRWMNNVELSRISYRLSCSVFAKVKLIFREASLKSCDVLLMDLNNNVHVIGEPGLPVYHRGHRARYQVSGPCRFKTPHNIAEQFMLLHETAS